jgi:hypothetical protein
MDIREAILVRLVAVLSALPAPFDALEAYRNRSDDLSPDLKPAIVIFDGDEHVEDVGEGPRVQQFGDVLARMRPQIVLSVGEYPDDVGTKLNALRGAVYKAIFTDSALRALVTRTGAILYHGSENQLFLGREMIGDMALHFAFVYPLAPSDF